MLLIKLNLNLRLTSGATAGMEWNGMEWKRQRNDVHISIMTSDSMYCNCRDGTRP